MVNGSQTVAVRIVTTVTVNGNIYMFLTQKVVKNDKGVSWKRDGNGKSKMRKIKILISFKVMIK